MINVKKTLLLLCLIITTPLVILYCILLINTINPMQIAFITRFEVENQSGQDIYFTPIGTVGKTDEIKVQLPIYITGFPALPAIKTRRFQLKQGETAKIIYDWDDVNFSELAVSDDDGQYYQVIVDPKPTENQYHPPKSKHFIIPPLDTLSPVQQNIHEAVMRHGRMLRSAVFYVSFALPVIYWRLKKLYKIEKGKHHTYKS